MSLKLKTNDDCFKTYEDLKFKKIDARYIIYKVEKKEVEVIVSCLRFRPLNQSEKDHKLGTISSLLSLTKNTDSQFLIWSLPMPTI